MLIIGIGLIATVASSTYAVTGRGTFITEEQLNLSDAINGDSGFMNSTISFVLSNLGVQCSSGGGQWVANSVVITNRTRTILTSGNYSVNYGNQSITFLNTSTLDVESTVDDGFLNGTNMTLVNYSYYPAGYICSAFGRTTLNLVPGFFGMALLVGALGMFYSVMREEGILGAI